MQTHSNNVPRILYTVEDAKGNVYTAHTDKAQTQDDGEEMVTFAKENGMDTEFWIVPHTLN